MYSCNRKMAGGMLPAFLEATNEICKCWYGEIAALAVVFLFNKQNNNIFLRKGKLENMLLGPSRCNRPSRYKALSLPPSLLKRSEGLTILMI